MQWKEGLIQNCSSRREHYSSNWGYNPFKNLCSLCLTGMRVVSYFFKAQKREGFEIDHNWYNIYKWNSTFSWLLRLLSSQIARTPSILAHCTVPSVNPFIVIIIIEQGCIISAQKRNWTDSWSTTVKQTQCPWQPFHAECIQKRNKKYFQDDDDEKRKMVTRILWNSDSCKSRWKTKL